MGGRNRPVNGGEGSSSIIRGSDFARIIHQEIVIPFFGFDADVESKAAIGFVEIITANHDGFVTFRNRVLVNAAFVRFVFFVAQRFGGKTIFVLFSISIRIGVSQPNAHIIVENRGGPSFGPVEKRFNGYERDDADEGQNQKHRNEISKTITFLLSIIHVEAPFYLYLYSCVRIFR